MELRSRERGDLEDRFSTLRYSEEAARRAMASLETTTAAGGKTIAELLDAAVATDPRTAGRIREVLAFSWAALEGVGDLSTWSDVLRGLTWVLAMAPHHRLDPLGVEEAVYACAVWTLCRAPGRYLVGTVASKMGRRIAARAFDSGRKSAADRVLAVATTLEELQICPPHHVAAAVEAALGDRAAPALVAKLRAPFRAARGTGRIVVDEEETALLASLGLAPFAVPSPKTPHFSVSRCAIDAFAIATFATAEGLRTELRGAPCTPAAGLFEDALRVMSVNGRIVATEAFIAAGNVAAGP